MPAPRRFIVGVRLIQPANPDIYYPAVAKHEEVSGYAIVEVDVDVLGQLVDARVLNVQPADPRSALPTRRWKSPGTPVSEIRASKLVR